MSSIEKAINKLGKKAADHDSSLPEQPAERSETHRVTETEHYISPDKPGRHVDLSFPDMQTQSLLTPVTTSSQLAEEFRNIKRPLLQNAFGKSAGLVDQGNLIMVTSALPGEGKTFTSLNLATSIAMELDRTVLLIDADVSMAGVTKRLGFDPGLGLSDVLADENLQLDDVLVTTNIPKLTILTAGKKKAHMTELLSSRHMNDLVADMANRYPDRIILLDSPPLMVTSEARVLAGLVGQIVVVVEAEKTPQQATLEALQSLDSTKAIGVVINKSHSFGSQYGYGYGYGERS